MRRIVRTVTMLFVLSMAATSCQNAQQQKQKAETDASLTVEVDTSSQTIKFGNTLFSLPSPYQLTMMVKKADVKFNEALLNPVSNNQNYTSQFQKCINLGIYGADLAYLNIYDQMPLVMAVFSVSKILASDLDLLVAFNNDLISRVEQNMDNKDSLLYIMSNILFPNCLISRERHRCERSAVRPGTARERRGAERPDGVREGGE